MYNFITLMPYRSVNSKNYEAPQNVILSCLALC
jgi:hypothetical protein